MAYASYIGMDAAPEALPVLPYEVNFIASYGQSNSIGAQATAGDTAFSNTPRDGLLMFGPQMNQGIEFTGFTKFQTPIAAIEEDKSVSTSNYNETPCRGMGEGLLDLIELRLGKTYAQHGRKILLAALGNGGEAIQNLVKEDGRAFGDYTGNLPTTSGKNFGVLEAAFAATKTWADSQGLTSGCPAIQFHWGADGYDPVSGVTKAQAKTYIAQLADDLQDAVATAFGQTLPCYLLITASQAHKPRNTVDDKDMYIAEAAQEVAETHPCVIMGIPQYANLYEGGEGTPGSSVHHRPSGYKIMGVGNADRLFWPVCARSDQGDFAPTAITRVSSTLIKVDFDVPADWELCWNFQTDYAENLRPEARSGFYVVDTGTTTTILQKTDATTSAPYLPYISGNSVYITMAAALPATADLTYGRETYGGNLGMRPRCTAARIPVVLQSSTISLPRYCTNFRKAIPA